MWRLQLHIFLTSHLDGGECLVSRPGRFTHGETTPDTYWTGIWMGPGPEVERRNTLLSLGTKPRSPTSQPSQYTHTYCSSS